MGSVVGSLMAVKSIVFARTDPITVLCDISGSVDTISLMSPLVDSCSKAADRFLTGVLAAEGCDTKVSSS